MAVTLFNYLTQTRRFLHDANGQFWSDAELTDYINEARVQTVVDTGCLRSLQSFTLTAGQELYPFTAFPTQQVLDVLNITVIFGSTRYQLVYRAFTDLSAQFRPFTNYKQLPVAFAVYGQNSIYLGPTPDIAYVTEVDTVIAPTPMTAFTDVETILLPFTFPVPYWAAHMAKISQQSYEESDKFQAMYQQRAMQVIQGSFTRRLMGGFDG